MARGLTVFATNCPENPLSVSMYLEEGWMRFNNKAGWRRARLTLLQSLLVDHYSVTTCAQ